MKNKRLFSVISVLIVMVLALSACAPAAVEPAAPEAPAAPAEPAAPAAPAAPVGAGELEPVRFLVFAMISGPNAESGRQVKMAVQTAEWYINEVLGGFPSLGGRPIYFNVVDSTSNAAQAPMPFEAALQANDYAVVIGNSNSSIALTQLPIVEAHQIPMITGAAANIAISEQGSSFSFQPAATSRSFIPTQLDFLAYYAEKLGVPVKELRLGLIHADDAWGTDNANNTRKQVAERGLNLAFDQSYNVAAFTDATPLITALKAADVDVLLPSSYPADLSLIFTAMGTLNFNPLVVGGGAAMTWPSLYVDLGDAVNGLTSVDSWVWDQTGAREHEGWQVMNKWYEEQFGEFIPGQAGPTLFSIMLAYSAIERIGSADPIAIRDELRVIDETNVDWFTIPNGVGKFDPVTGLNTGARAVMMQWQNGRPTAVFPPEFAASPLLNPETMQPFE